MRSLSSTRKSQPFLWRSWHHSAVDELSHIHSLGETLPCFSSNPCELIRVGNDANRLNLPLLHINGKDVECFFAGADDQGGLTLDFSWLDTRVLWPEAPRSQAKAYHCITPTNRTQ